MADGPPTPQAALPQPKSRQASESVAPGALPTAFVVSFAEEASLEAQAAAVAAKVAELQSVHDSLRAELDLRSRVKQLSGELAAANARCAEMEAAALKSHTTWQEKIQDTQQRLWTQEKRSEALSHQVQSLQEELQRAAADSAAAGERQRQLEGLLESRDRALAAKEQQLLESQHSNLAKVGPPQMEPTQWGWPGGPMGVPSQRLPGSDELNGGSPHHQMAPVFAQAQAHVQRMGDGGQNGGGGGPLAPGPAPFYPPGMMPNSPAMLAHHHHNHNLWPSQQAAPNTFVDFSTPHDNHATAFQPPPGMLPGMWHLPPQQAPVQVPHAPPPAMNLAPPAVVTPEPAAPAVPAGTERRTIVRTPMPPVIAPPAPAPPVEKVPPPRSGPVMAQSSKDFGGAFSQPPKPRGGGGGGGGGGGRRNGRNGGGPTAPTPQQASPVLMF